MPWPLAGMAQALGVGLYDPEGKPLARGGAALASLARIDLSSRDPRIRQIEIVAACDVGNPLLGLTEPSGFTVLSIVPGPMCWDEAMREASGLLAQATELAVRLVAVGGGWLHLPRAAEAP